MPPLPPSDGGFNDDPNVDMNTEHPDSDLLSERAEDVDENVPHREDFVVRHQHVPGGASHVTYTYHPFLDGKPTFRVIYTSINFVIYRAYLRQEWQRVTM